MPDFYWYGVSVKTDRLLNEGKVDEAIAYCQKMGAHKRAIELMEKQGRIDEAIAFSQEKGESKEAARLMGEQGRIEEAMTYLCDLARTEEGFFSVTCEAIEFAKKNNLEYKIVKIAREGMQMSKDRGNYFGAAYIAEEAGLIEDAIDLNLERGTSEIIHPSWGDSRAQYLIMCMGNALSLASKNGLKERMSDIYQSTIKQLRANQKYLVEGYGYAIRVGFAYGLNKEAKALFSEGIDKCLKERKSYRILDMIERIETASMLVDLYERGRFESYIRSCVDPKFVRESFARDISGVKRYFKI